MLVSLGAALFVIAVVESGMSNDGISRVWQGLITGIGFLGGGAILKLPQPREVKLTTGRGDLADGRGRSRHRPRQTGSGNRGRHFDLDHHVVDRQDRGSDQRQALPSNQRGFG